MLPAICILGAGVLVLVLTLVYCLHSSSKPDEVGERIIIEYTEETDLREITALIEKCGVDIQYTIIKARPTPPRKRRSRLLQLTAMRIAYSI